MRKYVSFEATLALNLQPSLNTEDLIAIKTKRFNDIWNQYRYAVNKYDVKLLKFYPIIGVAWIEIEENKIARFQNYIKFCGRMIDNFPVESECSDQSLT